MIKTNDIYFRMNFSINNEEYWKSSIEERKHQIDEALKKYILLKMGELKILTEISENLQDYSNGELLEIMARIIPIEYHHSIFDHFVHYILEVASTLQSRTIVWWMDSDENLIETPLVKFDADGFWDTLTTNEETDCIRTFNFVYDTFQKNFMCEKETLVKLLSIDNN